MERLVAEASRMTDVQKELGVTVEEGSLAFGNIINAISVVQKNLGIAGTTVEEAERTISGSLNMVKSSWQDLLTSIAGGGKEIDVAINDLVYSAEKFLENLIPRIEVALQGVGQLISNIAPIIADRLPSLVETLVPMLIETAAYVVSSLVNSLPDLITTIADALIGVLPQLIDAIITMLDSLLTSIIPTIFEIAIQIVIALGQGIADNTENIISGIMTLLNFVVETFIENLPMILEIALKIILALAEGLLNNLNFLTDVIVELIGGIITTIVENIPLILEMGLRIGLAIVEGILLAVPSLLVSIGRILGIVEEADRGVKDKGNSMKESMNSTMNDMTFSMQSAAKKVEKSSKDISTITEGAYKQTKDYSVDVVENARWAEKVSSDVLTKLNIVFQGMSDHAARFFETVKYFVNKSLEELNALSSFYARPLVDASGVEEGCSAIVKAVESAINALNRLSNTSASSGGFGGGRASGGFVHAGMTYLVGESGPELITPSRDMYVHNAVETERMRSGGNTFIFNMGDVYDDENSMKKKIRRAVTTVLEEEMSYA